MFNKFVKDTKEKAVEIYNMPETQEAINRAKDLDCLGACYPIATRNGKEGCNACIGKKGRYHYNRASRTT